MYGAGRFRGGVFVSERDSRLERLIFLSDGVYAIALTLLAIELVLPESADRDLLKSLLESWPKVLAFITSFTVIANFWVGHNVLFQHVRRFDGGLMWLALLQLLCVAFIPFPTSVIGGHISDPVAQQFYFATLLVTGLVMEALWWYMTSRRRLLKPDMSPQFVRRTHLISAILPVTILILMALVAVGIGHLINPLLLFAFATLCFIVLGILEWREEDEEPEDAEGQEPPVADSSGEGSAGRKREVGKADNNTWPTDVP
jgi:uncharacterized membrane protein